MISLDLFKSIVSHIKQQEEKDEKLTKLLIDPDFTGWVSTANNLIDDLVKLLEYELGDKYEYISWWLYDITDGEKFVYEDFKDDKQVRYNLNDLKDLYNYIIGDLEAVKQDIVCKNKNQNKIIYQEKGITIDEVFDTIWGKDRDFENEL